MPRKRRNRQFITVTAGTTPIPIPTEAFLELNPELETFVEEVYPYKIFPQTPAYYYYPKANYKYYYNSGNSKSKNTSNSACSPSRFCFPRPCNPV